MSPAKAIIFLSVLAPPALTACGRQADPGDDARMAKAMRKVEADQAKSDKFVMEHPDEETQKQVRIQNAIRER